MMNYIAIIEPTGAGRDDHVQFNADSDDEARYYLAEFFEMRDGYHAVALYNATPVPLMAPVPT